MDTSRIAMVIGREGLEKLQKAKIAVIGLGGVGSYVAEALVRSGIGTLLIIDGDTVDSSNVNRQLPALQSTLGKAKTAVMAKRLLDINPACKITSVGSFYKPGEFTVFFPADCDWIIDAIDDTASKVDIIKECKARNMSIISACGTGNKMDPTLLKVADLSKTSVCPLARSLRGKLKKLGITKGVPVVFSTEMPQKLTAGRTPGSMVFVPASAGLLLASYVVRQLLARPE